MSIPLGGSRPISAAISNASNQQTPTKRKRSQYDQPLAPHPAPTGWLGIAFQLPSVIKKEFNDFFKTVRGGAGIHSASSNSHSSIHHISRSNNKPGSQRSKHIGNRRLSRSVPASDYRVSPRNRRSAGLGLPPPRKADCPPRIPSPEFAGLDLPSPSKKFKLSSSQISNMTVHLDHPPIINHQPIINDQPIINHQNTTCDHSLGSSPNRPSSSLHQSIDLTRSHSEESRSCSRAQALPPLTYSNITNPHKPQHDNDADMEEIISTRPHQAPLSVLTDVPGSNSVLFPDSKIGRGLDSPSSSVNADISSSTWQASSSFSTNSASHTCRAFSNTTSLTSNTSADLNACEELQVHSLHTSRLNSGGSMTSPRIRYTKILGSPRSSSRIHTLSATSFSSIGSAAVGGVPGPSAPFPPSTLHRRALVKHSKSGSTFLDPLASSSCKPSDDDREFLTSDSDGNNEGEIGTQLGPNHTRVSRRKVPLAEIIGRPINASPSLTSLSSTPDFFRESYELNPSPSIASIASSFAGFPMVANNIPQLNSQLYSFQNSYRQPAKIPNENDNIVDSSFSAADTSNSLGTSRRQMTNPLLLSASSQRDPISHLPNSPPKVMEEVDQEDEDNSYEFLEKEEVDGISSEILPRKRKRILHRGDLIHFRRQGLAAIESASNKLIDLPPSQSQVKPKPKVMLRLGLSRSSHRRTPSNLETQTPGDSDVQGNPSPTKKIRILEREIARLRQELEDEKTKSVQRLSLYHSLNNVDHDPTQSNPSPHVAFATRSPFAVSSPASSSRHSHLASPGSRSLASKRASMLSSALLDSPVVVKKPCDGATVGGSPFIVPRVFGDGPEVTGECTPAQAEKWLQKRKAAPITQCGVRLPGIANDLFGAKSSRSAQSMKTSEGSSANRFSTSDSNWNRDRELEADLFSSPRHRTLKKSNRNSKGPAVRSTSISRHMVGNSVNNSHRCDEPKRCNPAGSNIPEMSTFLNELKSCGRKKLRKTPGSPKYCNFYQSFGSPKRNIGIHADTRHRRSVDLHNASILNSVMNNFAASEGHSYSGRDIQPSRTSTVSGRTVVTSSSYTLADEGSGNEDWNMSSSTAADLGKSDTGSQQQSNPPDQKSPLCHKIYPSGATPKQTRLEDGEIQVILGEAISTPRGSKQVAHLSRSLVDPHMTPRARGLNCPIPLPHSPVEKEFTMDELIKQVKDMKNSVVSPDAKVRKGKENEQRNRVLVHEMGFCSSAENSLDLTLSSPSALSGGSSPYDMSISRVMNSRPISQESNRVRKTSILKNLTQKRDKLSVPPIESRNSDEENFNPLSSNSTIRLVSILNNPTSNQSSIQSAVGDSTILNRSILSLGSSSRASQKRVRILEDTNHLDRSRESNGINVSRRHSMPVDLKTSNDLSRCTEQENHQEIGNLDDHSSSASPASRSPSWVVLKPAPDRLGIGEPNLRRWSLKTSAILMAHPKIV